MFKPSRILAFALTIVVCSTFAHARQFQSSDVEAPDHPAVRSVAYMGELMRQRSGWPLVDRRRGRLGPELPRSSPWRSCAPARSTWRGSA